MKNKKTAIVHLRGLELKISGFESFNTREDNYGNLSEYEFTDSYDKVIALFPGHAVIGVVITTNSKKGKK